MKKISFLCLIVLLWSACEDEEVESVPVAEQVHYTPNINYTIVGRLPHDKSAFIEGLLMHEGKLFESTGSPHDMPETKSLIGIMDTATGKLNSKIQIDGKKYFGEGIVFLNDKLYQLTYQNKIGFIYNAKSFEKLGEFSFPMNEGWGMTTDGTHLIMSDGTHILTFLNPNNFSVAKTVSVTNEYGFVQNLNELEFINGKIFANIYTTNTLVKIDASSGKVLGKLDATQLFNEARTKHPQSLEFNGIAYDQNKDVLLVTGKMWPTIFELKLN